METKKKTSKTTKSKEKQLTQIIEGLEEKIEQIENVENLKNRIKDKKQAIIEDLQNQLIQQNKFGKQFDDMLEDYLYLVELKERLQNDIEINGIRYKTTGGNGFTTYKANESCERLLKTNAQMLKILQVLDLKAPDIEKTGDDGNDLL